MARLRIVGNEPELFGPWIDQVLGNPVYKPGFQVLALVDEQPGERQIVAAICFAEYSGMGHAVQVHIVTDGTKRLTREFMAYAFHYALLELGVEWIIGMCYGNEAAVSLDRKLGFEERVRLDNGHPAGDIVMLTMRAGSEAAEKWLNRGARYQWSRRH